MFSRSILRLAVAVTGCVTATVLGSPAGAEPFDTGDEPTPCWADQIAVNASPTEGAVGHRGVTLVFTLAGGGGPCTLTGYPGVDSGAGGPLLHAQQTPRGYLGGLPANVDAPHAVTLSVTQQAQAIVEGIADPVVAGSGNPCPTYTDLLVNAPDTVFVTTVPANIEACQLQVHPITPS